jgi:hypothetical protein
LIFNQYPKVFVSVGDTALQKTNGRVAAFLGHKIVVEAKQNDVAIIDSFENLHAPLELGNGEGLNAIGATASVNEGSNGAHLISLYVKVKAARKSISFYANHCGEGPCGVGEGKLAETEEGEKCDR